MAAGSSWLVELIGQRNAIGNDTGEDLSPNSTEPEGEEQQRKRSKAALTDEFRLAIKDHKRLDRLIAQADKHPVDVWRKALLWASSSGHAEFIIRLMKRRHPVLNSLLQAARDADGLTSLHRAVIMREKDIVKLLTRHSPENAQAEYNFDVLHARTPEGWTALHFAVVTGDEDIVQILMESYGLIPTPPDFEWDFADNFWMTPLHYAVLGNLQAVMKQLLEWPAYDRHVNAHDYYMRTPAHMASCRGEGTIDILVSNPKVDINAVDCCSYTPLHWAVYVGATEAVRCLVSKAGKRTIRITEEDIEGRPVFQTAIENTTMDRKVCKDIEKLLLTCAEVKDEVERLYRDRQVYVDASNAILVGAALIASVTFGGWLQPPGGSGDGGDGHADRELQVFWIFNSLSFFFSIATVMAGAGAVLPMEDVYIGRAVRNIRGALGLTSFLLIISAFFVLVAFGASGFASLVSTPNLKENMIVTTIVGSTVCTIILLWFLQRLYKIRPDWRRFVLPAIEKCHQSVSRRRQGRDLADIQMELEAAELRAREEKYGRSAVDRRRVDLTDLVSALGKASDRASQLRRMAHDTAVIIGIADGMGGSLSVRHLKERVLEQRILAFEEAYERARMIGTDDTSGQLPDPAANMLILSHIDTRGLHHWIDEFPTSYCRTRSLKKDSVRWTRILGRVTLVKTKLEDANTKFEYGMLAFDDWAV